MNFSPVPIQLTWKEPETGEVRSPILTAPIALGREFDAMPSELEGCRISRMVLNNDQVSRFHALIAWENSNFVVIDQDSCNGFLINGQPKTRSPLANGDTLVIDPYEILIKLGVKGEEL